MNTPNEKENYKSFRLVGFTSDEASEYRLPTSREILNAIYFAIILQTIIAVFLALILDGGNLLRQWTYAVVVSWIVSLVILVRHVLKLSKPITFVDIAIIKHGVWFAALLILICEILITAFLP